MVSKKEIVCYYSDSSRFNGKCENVFFPKTIEEVQSIIKSSTLDIVSRGGGLGLVGGAVPNNSNVIDLSKMIKISNFNPINKKVHVEAGVIVKELNEKLRPLGYEFPIYFEGQDSTTIGAMIATNSPGDRSLRYGNIKDWFEEIEYVNGKGEFLKTSKADLMEICGMEGTTGIIVGAILKIIPIMKRSASIFQTDNLEEVFSVTRKLKIEKEISMIELFSPTVSKFLGFPEKYNLIVEFDSDRGKIKGEDYDKLVKIRNKVYFALYSQEYFNSEDPKLFFDKVKEFIIFLEENKVPYFGYLGTGVIYAFFLDKEKEKREKVMEYLLKSKSKFGEYGIGIFRKNFIDSFDIKVVQRIKSRNDPFSKLNKGKFIDIENRVKRVESKPDEIIPTIGEEKSAKEIINRVKNQENEFKSFVNEVKTWESEKPKNITPGVRKIEEIKRPVEIKPSVEPKPIIEKFEKPKNNVDYKSIRDIMTNKYSAKSTEVKKVENTELNNNEKELMDKLLKKFRSEETK